MPNIGWYKFPWLSGEVITSAAWEFKISEDNGATWFTVAVATLAASYDNWCEFLDAFLNVVNTDADIVYQDYTAWLDTENGRLGFSTTGDKLFLLDFSYNAGAIALGKVLGMDTRAAGTVQAAMVYGVRHPRYCWMPKRPMAGLDEPRTSDIISSQDYNKGVSVTASPTTTKLVKVGFQNLTRRQAYIESLDPYASFEQFWKDVKAGYLVTVFRNHHIEDTDFDITDVDANKELDGDVNADYTRLKYLDADPFSDYLNGYEILFISGLMKGQRATVLESGYFDATKGCLTFWEFTDPRVPASTDYFRVYYPSFVGYLDAENSQLPVKRMNTGVEFYEVEFTLAMTS